MTSTETAMPAAACRPGTLAGDLRVAIGRSARRLRAERGQADLPEGQFAILVHLLKDGPATPGSLAERERVRPPSMTRAVQALEELGLVERSEHPTDGRVVVVSLTDAGAEEIRETRRRRDAWLTRQLATLTPTERETLARAAGLLSRIAEA